MTLPDKDAFTLGLTGTYDPTRPSYHLSLRSTSPKIPFVSGHTKATTAYSNPRQTLKSRRPMSNGDTVSPKTPRNTQPNGSFQDTSSTSPTTIDWEIPRKALHSSIGFLTIYLYVSHGSSRAVVAALSMALAIIVPTDVLRLNSPGFEHVYERYLGFLMRESEKKSSNGVIWYILGVIFVLSVYPLDIAVVAILILSWADTAASTVGRLWGRYTPPLPRKVPILRLPFAPRKSLAGFIAGSLTGAAAIIGFWGWVGPLGADKPIWQWDSGISALQGSNSWGFRGWTGLGTIGIIGGLASGIAEALDLGSLDDNLTLPIISGGCIWGLFKCLQYLTL